MYLANIYMIWLFFYSMKRKSISLSEDIYDLVSMIKTEYEAETEKRHSFPAIIFMLCQYYLTNKEPISPIEIEEKEDSNLRKKLDETNDFIKEAFMTLISNTKTQTIVVAGGGGGQYVPTHNVIEQEQIEAPKRKLSDEEIKAMQLKLLDSDDGTFVTELDDIVDASGGAISPSIVAKVNGCNAHDETKEEYEERRAKDKKKRKRLNNKVEKELTKKVKESLKQSVAKPEEKDGPVVENTTPKSLEELVPPPT